MGDAKEDADKKSGWFDFAGFLQFLGMMACGLFVAYIWPEGITDTAIASLTLAKIGRALICIPVAIVGFFLALGVALRR